MVLLEQRAHSIGLGERVVLVGVGERERPAELEVLSVLDREVRGTEVVAVVSNEAVAQRGPGEEVDGDGMAGGFLGTDGTLPVRH